jgi:hypothetical protein
MSAAMAGLGVSLGPRTPETLIEEVGRLPGVVRDSSCRRLIVRCTGSSPCSSRITKGWTARC